MPYDDAPVLNPSAYWVMAAFRWLSGRRVNGFGSIGPIDAGWVELYMRTHGIAGAQAGDFLRWIGDLDDAFRVHMMSKEEGDKSDGERDGDRSA